MVEELLERVLREIRKRKQAARAAYNESRRLEQALAALGPASRARPAMATAHRRDAVLARVARALLPAETVRGHHRRAGARAAGGWRVAGRRLRARWHAARRAAVRGRWQRRAVPHLCGRWYRDLASSHLPRAHQPTAAEYRELVGLRPRHPLQAPARSAAQGELMRRRIAAESKLRAALAAGATLARRCDLQRFAEAALRERPAALERQRQLANAIHTIAIIRAEHQPETRAYLDRRIREGKIKREAMRALKRHISRELFKRLTEIPLTS